MRVKKIGVIGLGYVGLPVAVAFAGKYPVIGFDVDRERIISLQKNIDITGEVSQEELVRSSIEFTYIPEKIKECNFIIIAVPTPINEAKQPDLNILLEASRLVGENLQEGAVVVYESTVYPGATEEDCIPVLEGCSGLKAGEGFFVGYSPERINPGDKKRKFKDIVKVVSAQDADTLNILAQTYGEVVEAGVHKASSIKVAEAAKVIENTQRDLNIALMNELAMIFDKLNIDTGEVLAAAGTKWNFLPFTPGLVGGHCIGVDPYYLTYKAESIGYHPQVILAGRRINDNMGKFIATSLVKKMIQRGVTVQGARVTVLGITFKENVADLRNTKVIDLIYELQEYGVKVQALDPLASSDESKKEYGIELASMESLEPAEAVVLAVPHKEYSDMGWNITFFLNNKEGVVIDVKSVLDINGCPDNVTLWRL